VSVLVLLLSWNSHAVRLILIAALAAGADPWQSGVALVVRMLFAPRWLRYQLRMLLT